MTMMIFTTRFKNEASSIYFIHSYFFENLSLPSFSIFYFDLKRKYPPQMSESVRFLRTYNLI